jgi:translation initiation factor IF-2
VAQLSKLEAEKAEKEKMEAFNQRMASFDERFKLNDEDRKVLASQIKDLDEEQFVDFDKTVSVLLSSKAHSDEPAPEAPAEDPAPAAPPAEETPAPAPAEEPAPAEASASEVKEVLEQAVDNAKDELVNIPASAPAEEPTIFEKYGNAFAMDQFDINCKF